MGAKDILAQAEKDYIASKRKGDKLAFGKLLNRTKENFDKDKPKNTDRLPEIVKKVEKMPEVEFIISYRHGGEVAKYVEESIEAGLGDPFYHDMLCVSDKGWSDYEAWLRRQKPELVKRRTTNAIR